MMVIAALVLSGLLGVEEAFTGFSSPAVITVWAIYMVSEGINRVGIADAIGERMLRVAGKDEKRLVAIIMITVAGMSAFTNNIGATAILLPAVISIANRADISPSRLLIPLSFGSLLGGVTTLIGTPPNLLVNVVLSDAGIPAFSLLDYTPMGLIILVSSIFYMVFVGRHMLPKRERETTTDLSRRYHLRSYLAELQVMPNSILVGKTINESRLGEVYNLTVLGVRRNGEMNLGSLEGLHIHANDRLIVDSTAQQLLQNQTRLGVQFDPKLEITPEDLYSPETMLAEVVISQKAQFAGQTIKEVDFRGHYGLTVLAVWHEAGMLRGPNRDMRVRLGDILLVYGRPERIEALSSDNQFLLLGPLRTEGRRKQKAPLAVGIFVALISAVAFGWLDISIAVVIGVILYILTGCLTMDEAYRAVEWKSVFLIAGMLPLGIAMEHTGTAAYLADSVVAVVGGLGPRGVMVGLFVLTTLLTAFMSNAAAAVLVVPIAISAAATLGVAPQAFAMSVGMAASNAFVTPVSHQSNVLVYGPGGYRFFDFTKVGLPLTMIGWALMLIFMPIFWPF